MTAKEDREMLEKKTAELANIVTHYAIDNNLSFSEVMKSLEIVKETFYQNGIIKKAE